MTVKKPCPCQANVEFWPRGKAGFRDRPSSAGWFCAACGTVFPEWAFPRSSGEIPDPEALPMVLAVPLANHLGERHSPILRLWSLCEFVEALLKFLTMIGLGEAGTAPKAIQNRIHAPLLGDWLRFFRTLANDRRLSGKPGSLLPELSSRFAPCLDDLFGKPGSGESGDTLVRVRNRLAHGDIKRAEAHQLALRFQPPFERLSLASSWFSRFHLIAVKADGSTTLLHGLSQNDRGVPEPEPGLPSLPELPGRVFLRSPEGIWSLWPLFNFEAPKPGLEPGSDTRPRLGMFIRVGREGPEMLPIGSEEIPVTISTAPSHADFVSFFHLSPLPSRFSWARNISKTILTQSAKMVGRNEAIERVRRCVRDAIRDSGSDGCRRVIWAGGPAGVGKSTVMSALMAGYLAGSDPDTGFSYVVPFRFEAGANIDPVRGFCLLSLERLGKLPEDPEGRTTDDLELILQGCLQEHPGGSPILFLLDGLDEICRLEPTFPGNFPFSRQALGRTVWVCAGRECPELGGFLEEKNVTRVFGPSGLPPLTPGEVSAMVKEGIGNLARGWLKSHETWHREEASRFDGTFEDRLSRVSEGLPLYIDLFVRDVRERRIRSFDLGTRLPPSLEAYQEELLQRLKVGSVPQILTPIVCHLALAGDGMTVSDLTGVLCRRKLLAGGKDAEALVRTALGEIGRFFGVETATPEGVPTRLPGLIRSFVLGNPTFADALATARDAVETARDAVATAKDAVATREGPPPAGGGSTKPRNGGGEG